MVVAAIFESVQARQRGLEALQARGIPKEAVVLVGSDGQGENPADEKLATGSAVGAAVGGGLGILAGAGLLLVPGVGAIAALALAGAGLGAIGGALSDWAIPEHHGRRLQQVVASGKVALLIRDQDPGQMAAVLRQWADETYPASQ